VTAGPRSSSAPSGALDLAGLRPVSEAIARDASQRAEQVLADADADAADVVSDATRQSDRLLDAARAEGAASARRLAAAEVADARREGRNEVLAAQRAAYDDVRDRARSRLEALRGSPDAEALTTRLESVARRQLGDDVTIEPLEETVGIIAHQGTRRLDLSADTLIDRVVSSMSADIVRLWS
jgi:vacuolar-type H+-ATPase subunit E/Vma4